MVLHQDGRKPFSFSKRLHSFKYAFRGIGLAFRSQHNLRIHLCATVLVVVLACWFDISITKWIAILLSIGFVLVAELFNTAIEELVNLVSPGHDKKAGLVKDLAAGAVLLSAITAAAVGLIVFLPEIIERL